MMKIVMLPIVFGLLINRYFSKYVEKNVDFLPFISVVALMIIVGGVVSVAGVKLVSAGVLLFFVVLIHNLLGYGIGYFISRYFGMDYAKARAVSIEVGMQNAGLGSTLAVAFFNPIAAIPCVIAAVPHIITGSTLANYFASQDEKVYKKNLELSTDVE